MTGTEAGTALQAAPRRPRERGTEIGLLFLAVLLPFLGHSAVGLAVDGTLPPGAAGHGAGLGAFALGAHLVVRGVAPRADPLLLPVAVLLNGLGLVLIDRLDRNGPDEGVAGAQLVWSAVGVGLFALVLLAVRHHQVLRRGAKPCMVAALVLMLAPVFFPSVNGARIWIRVGEFSFQPGELAKLLLAVFFADRLAAGARALTGAGRRLGPRRLPDGRALGPVLAVWLLSMAVLVLEHDLGTSLLFFGLFMVLLYAATGRFGWIVLGLLLASAGAFAVGTFEPHVHARITDWLHPFASIEAGEGPGQLAQSLFAFGAGGVTGTGLGLGHSALIGFAAKSDFVLATLAEELGLAGLVAVLLLYGVLVERGYRTALMLPDTFGRLLATALAALVALQVFVITGGVSGLIPLTGMPMPFLAQGGSAVVTHWMAVALLVRMSHAARSGVTAEEPADAQEANDPDDARTDDDPDDRDEREDRKDRKDTDGAGRGPGAGAGVPAKDPATEPALQPARRSRAPEGGRRRPPNSPAEA